MEQQTDSKSLTTQAEDQTLSPSTSEESTQRSSEDSQSVLTPEEEARAAQAREDLEKKAEEAKARRASRGGRGSSEAARAVRERTAAQSAETGEPKKKRAKVKVDDGPAEEVEVEGFEEKDIEDFLGVTDELLEAFKVKRLSDSQKKRLAKPLTRVVNKRLNKKIKKFSDEAQVGLIVFGLVLERINLAKQSRNSVRDEGAGKDDASQKITQLRAAADSH